MDCKFLIGLSASAIIGSNALAGPAPDVLGQIAVGNCLASAKCH